VLVIFAQEEGKEASIVPINTNTSKDMSFPAVEMKMTKGALCFDSCRGFNLKTNTSHYT
jgi:hypothetical protein